MTSFLLTIWLFDLPILTAITLIYLLVFWGLLYRLLLFWKAGKLEDNTSDEVSSFYEYTVAQIKHEEALRKEFTNYLHDDILQDLLSMKNLVRKADQIEIQRLLEDTLRKLTSSIRLQMQAYRSCSAQTGGGSAGNLRAKSTSGHRRSVRASGNQG